MDILNIIKKYKDDKYKQFQEKICKTKYEIIGIKIPILRKISKDLIKNNNTDELLCYNYDKYFELIIIEGFIIANINVDYNKRLMLISNYLKKIDNWAICDTFCSALKFIKKDLEEFLNYLNKIKKVKKEYYQRFYIVILLQYYLNNKYINYNLEELLNIKSDKYYVKMAIAWNYSICLVKYYDITYNYLKNNKDKIDTFTLNKIVSKAKDSYRLTIIQKEELEKLKKS